MFRFTLREAFLLTMLVAVGLGWGIDHVHASIKLWRYDWWKSTAVTFGDLLKEEGYNIQLDEELCVLIYGKRLSQPPTASAGTQANTNN